MKIYILLQENFVQDDYDKSIIGVTNKKYIAEKWAKTKIIQPTRGFLSGSNIAQTYEIRELNFITGEYIIHGTEELEHLFLNEFEKIKPKKKNERKRTNK